MISNKRIDVNIKNSTKWSFKQRGFSLTKSSFILTILLLTLLIMPSVLAIGISPARTTIDFEAGLEKTYSFSVLNSENQKTDIVIVSGGELSQYIELSSEYDTLQAEQGSKEYSFTLRLPDSLEPGKHEGEIRVVTGNSNSGEGTSVNARIALVHQVIVNVPYPGKHIETELKIIPSGELTRFYIPVNNRGKDRINSIKAEIEIYLAGEKQDTIQTEEISLAAGQRGELYSEWRPSKIGEYFAQAKIVYDGAEKILEKNFEVGETLIQIENIEAVGFKLGEVAKFNLVLNNKWSEDVRDVYVRMEFYKNGKMIQEVKTPTKDIPAGRVENFDAFFDTSGIEAGTYDVRIILNYNGKSAERDTTAEITDNSIVVFGFGGSIEGKSSWMTILIVVLVIVIIGNIAWFIFLRKKFFKKK